MAQASPMWASQAGTDAGPDGPSAIPAWASAKTTTAQAGLGQAPDDASSSRQPTQSNAVQAAYFDSTRDPVPAGSATLTRTPETPELKYMRQTRNACVFIAVIVGIFTTLTLIGVIWGVVTLNTLHNDLNNGVSNLGNSNCSSVGGTDPSC
ncbi:MAG TPA: hypothetical protein VGI74_14855 [Streptosporangiaceae bacterium]